MANTSTDSEIRTRIDSFLAELSGLVRRAALESVHEVLSETAPKRRRGPGRPKGAGRRGPGRPRKATPRARTSTRLRRSAADLEKIAARVLAHVKSNAGHRLEQIGKALKVETAVLKRPVANLLAGRKLRTKGQKRGTMYFAGGGGARNSPRKAKARRLAKRARKAKARGRRPARRARKASKKRTAPPVARRGPARKQRVVRKRSRKIPASKATAIADALALQAALPTAPV